MNNFGRQRHAPYSHNGSTTNTDTRHGTGTKAKTNNKDRHRRSNEFSWKRQLAMGTLSIVLGGIWYGTPLSDILLEQILEHVPLQADIELEEAALRQVQVSTYYDSYWTGVVQEIGDDLVRILEKSCQHRRGRSREDDGSDTLLCQFSQPRNWDFGLVDEPRVVNAFCFPAGTIRITTGLLHRLSPSRGEVAALLGHEMGHVLRRHASKRLLSQNIVRKIWDTLNYEDDDGYDESWGEALGELLLESATWLGQQRFSPRDEYQADAVSWALLRNSKIYGPKAMIRLLERLHSFEGGPTRQASSSTWTTALEDWSSTHPATADRIQALQDAWAALPVHVRKKYEARAYPY